MLTTLLLVACLLRGCTLSETPPLFDTLPTCWRHDVPLLHPKRTLAPALLFKKYFSVLRGPQYFTNQTPFTGAPPTPPRPPSPLELTTFLLVTPALHDDVYQSVTYAVMEPDGRIVRQYNMPGNPRPRAEQYLNSTTSVCFANLFWAFTCQDGHPGANVMSMGLVCHFTDEGDRLRRECLPLDDSISIGGSGKMIHHDFHMNLRTGHFFVLVSYANGFPREYDRDGRTVWQMPSLWKGHSHFNTLFWDPERDVFLMNDYTNKHVWLVNKTSRSVIWKASVPPLHDVQMLDRAGNFLAYLNDVRNPGFARLRWAGGRLHITARRVSDFGLDGHLHKSTIVGAVRQLPLGEVVATICAPNAPQCLLLQAMGSGDPFVREVDLNRQTARNMGIYRMSFRYAAPPVAYAPVSQSRTCFHLWGCYQERETVAGTLDWTCGAAAAHKGQTVVRVLPFWQATRLCVRACPGGPLRVRFALPQCAAPTEFTLRTALPMGPHLFVGQRVCHSSFCEPTPDP